MEDPAQDTCGAQCASPGGNIPLGESRLRGGAASVPHDRTRVRSWLWPALSLALAPLALLLLPATGLMDYVYFDRSDLPDINPLIRFEPPTTGAVYDARGMVLIEVATEYRRVVSYDEVPLVLRQAILSAEDKNFLSHSGVEYRAFPRVLEKSAMRTLATWWENGAGFRLRFPQGGSTITQQLVRGYFLQDMTSRENGDTLIRTGLAPRCLAAFLGVPATNKLVRKIEELRLSFWLEEEMTHRYGSRELAKREIFARHASFVYLGNGRYGFAAASEYYFNKPLSGYSSEDDGVAALLAGISKSPGVYAPMEGAPQPLRRRNEILALMARNGYISWCRAKQVQAEPIRVATRDQVTTHAPAAIENVFDELKRHGGDRLLVEDLFQGRIAVHTTLDQRVQTIVNESLEEGLTLYEARHRRAKGLIQGSVVVLRNADAAILGEAGGRLVFRGRCTRYSDFNRVTDSLRQPGSAWKPMVYLAAFHKGLDLETAVPDEPIEVPLGSARGVKWIANYDNKFKGLIPVRQALAESRNAVAVWVAGQVGLAEVARVARGLGIRTPLQPFISTALGASEVRLMELANAYRAMASELLAEPHVIERVIADSCGVIYEAPHDVRAISDAGLSSAELRLIQEGLRGVVRLPDGTAHALDGPDFPIPVMAKTGTTSDFRDALFLGSTYGPQGITVAVRIGFDDNRALGEKETGARVGLPVFRAIMLRIYRDGLAGPVPLFPPEIEQGIDAYLARLSMPDTRVRGPARHARAIPARAAMAPRAMARREAPRVGN